MRTRMSPSYCCPQSSGHSTDNTSERSAILRVIQTIDLLFRVRLLPREDTTFTFRDRITVCLKIQIKIISFVLIVFRLLLGSHLPAIVKDNTSAKTTIICSNHLSPSSQPTVALLNGSNQVICCTLNDHQLCDHNNIQTNGQLRQQYLMANSLNNLNQNCLSSTNRHLSSDC